MFEIWDETKKSMHASLKKKDEGPDLKCFDCFPNGHKSDGPSGLNMIWGNSLRPWQFSLGPFKKSD